MNRSTSEQIGTKQPGTHGRIEVILSFCSKCRRGLQALVPEWRDYTFIPMSYSCPCVSFSSLFYSCSLRTHGVKLMLCRAVWFQQLCRDEFHRKGSSMRLVLHSELFLSFRLLSGNITSHTASYWYFEMVQLQLPFGSSLLIYMILTKKATLAKKWTKVTHFS